jgi:hypothetical protein
MIDRLLAAVQRGIAGVIGVLILFGLLIGLVIWARSDPDAVQALVGKLVEAVVCIVTWLCDLVIRTLDGAGDR